MNVNKRVFWALIGLLVILSSFAAGAAPRGGGLAELKKKYRAGGSRKAATKGKNKPNSVVDDVATVKACEEKWKNIWTATGNGKGYEILGNAPLYVEQLKVLDAACASLATSWQALIDVVSQYTPEQYAKELGICLYTISSQSEFLADVKSWSAQDADYCKALKPCLEAGSAVQTGNCPKIPAAISYFTQHGCKKWTGGEFIPTPPLTVPEKCSHGSQQ